MIVNGVVNAIVARTEQTGGVGRVLVTFPWLQASHRGTWARVAAPLSGASTGQWFMPEVNDEVLVAFEHGDFDHPYVVGALWNGQDATPETDPQRRVIVTPGGHQLRFEDNDGAKQVVLRTQGNQQLVLSDSAAGTKAHLSTNGGCELLIDDGGTIRARNGGRAVARARGRRRAGRAERRRALADVARRPGAGDVMPPVLTTKAVITCPHGGVGQTVSEPTWVADHGGPVSVEGDAGVLACPFVLLPCGGYTLRSMGLNATTILGRRVILATDFQTSQTGLPLQITETANVIDDSSPAPLPADGSAPPADPAMLDLAPPVVVAVPPVLLFNTVTQLPPPTPIAATLTSAFPSRYNVTLLNTAAGQNIDLTNGGPGVTVVPAGGEWTSPSLVLNIQFTPPFLSALGPGAHELYCTGVSQRGLSAHAKVTVTVS